MDKVYWIARLIQYYITGRASVEEQEEVERWIEQSKRHRELFEMFKTEGYVDRQHIEHEIFDEKKGFVRFIAAKRLIDKRRMLRRVISVAAFFILLVGVGGWILFQGKQEIPLAKLEENPIVPGGRKAVLVLNNGEHVDLKDAMLVEAVGDEAQVLVGDSMRFVVKEDSIEVAQHSVFTPVGGEYNLTLSDGTRVWLNAASRLQFPSVFRKDRREVQAEGEVYFEVAKDAARPFRVRTGGVVVEVLGTSFNIRAYPEEEYKTTLVEGSVAVNYLDKTMKIKPGQQWVLGKTGPRVQEVKVKSVIGWKNGSFAFEDQVLSKVFNELERWYGIHVFVENELINDIKFTGIFPRYEDINKVLTVIELATCVKCVLDEENVIVRIEK